jgi:hypothetical protein
MSASLKKAGLLLTVTLGFLSAFVLFLPADVLNQALKKMDEHPEMGLLLPRFKSESGQDLYLAKRYPNILVLFMRGFAPAWLKKLFQNRRQRELKVQ